MKLVIDITNEKPKENDLLVYKNKTWKPVNKEFYLKELQDEIKRLQITIAMIKNESIAFKEAVNDKLKSFHNVLQTIVKEDE